VRDPTNSGPPAKATSDGIAKAALDLLEPGLTFLSRLAQARLVGIAGGVNARLRANESSQSRYFRAYSGKSER
jgi:hypothetical protein